MRFCLRLLVNVATRFHGLGFNAYQAARACTKANAYTVVIVPEPHLELLASPPRRPLRLDRGARRIVSAQQRLGARHLPQVRHHLRGQRLDLRTTLKMVSAGQWGLALLA